jgi:mono/diheme cytochrome c family protein
VPRYVTDEYELPDDYEDDFAYEGRLYRRRRRSPLPFLAVLGALFFIIAGVGSFVFVNNQQAQDSFCLECHTPQHDAYVQRAESSVGGALAPDLASYHYQQIRGLNSEIHCIDCHRGDDSLRHRVDTYALSARMTVRWLAGSDDQRIEKTAITSTLVSGITQTVAQTSLALHDPVLTNASCIGCHQQEMLVAGDANHMHNTLPAVYEAWKNGARLIPPADATDPQAVVAEGLLLYNTTLQCHNCHQAHRSTESPNYLDLQNVVKPACEQCHAQAGAGPLDVTVTEGQ